VDPQAFYNAVLDDDVAKMKTLLMQDPQSLFLDADKAETCLSKIKSDWCVNNGVDLETIKQMTKLLSANLSQKGKTDAIIDVIEWYKLSTSSWTTFEYLRGMVQNIAPTVDLQSLGLRIPKFMDFNMLSKNQVFAGLTDLVNKAKDMKDRSKANDLLTKANMINLEALAKFKDDAKSKKIQTNIDAAEAAQTEKDKELLTTRINDYFNKDAEYKMAMQKMVKQILEMNGRIEGNPEEAALCKIIVGTMDRNFQDGLLYRFKEMNAKVNSVVAFLFFGANDNVFYEGAKYKTSDVLAGLFLTESFYNPSILDDAYKAASNTGFIGILGEEFLMKDVMSGKAFRNVESLQEMFPVVE
jgi:hypothetical protein